VNKHPYLRAYLAGIAVPSVVLLVAMTVYAMARHTYDFPVPIERVIIFPMAIVPAAWGLWNVLYVAVFAKRRVPLGLYGSALPLILIPCAYGITRLVDFPIPHVVASALPFAATGALVLYYLVWKYLVGFLNAELGIA
jgi:hypothetical protein